MLRKSCCLLFIFCLIRSNVLLSCYVAQATVSLPRQTDIPQEQIDEVKEKYPHYVQWVKSFNDTHARQVHYLLITGDTNIDKAIILRALAHSVRARMVYFDSDSIGDDNGHDFILRKIKELDKEIGEEPLKFVILMEKYAQFSCIDEETGKRVLPGELLWLLRKYKDKVALIAAE